MNKFSNDLNKQRRALYSFLHTLKDTATDIFWGNYFIEEKDRDFISDDEVGQAFDKACAVVAYRALNCYGGDTFGINSDLFPDIPDENKADTPTLYFIGELTREFGRQVHSTIAVNIQNGEFYETVQS